MLMPNSIFKGLNGVEIGGPSRAFNGIYKVVSSCDGVDFSQNNTWWDKSNSYEYDGRELGQLITADATDLSQINDASYDFCMSSNNLEHIANPLKALKEYVRVTKCNGLILVAVPRKDKCFDHNRDYTDIKHIIEDYENDLGEDDLSHLPEILDKHDFSMDIGCSSREQFEIRSKDNYKNRCLHHHVYDVDTLTKMFEWAGIKLIKKGVLPREYYVIGEKK